MRIGLISDVHANYHALEAVLSDMGDVDMLLCAGDLIGYGPLPQKTVERVRDKADVVVRGNHDRKVTQRDEAKLSSDSRTLAKQELSEEQLGWLESLNPTENVEVGETTILLSHSHPDNEDEYVFKRDFPKMGNVAEDEDVLVLGHTHQHTALDLAQFTHDLVVINPGSVGHPRGGKGPEARYGILSITDGEIETELRSVEYDVEAAVEAVREKSLPEETVEQYQTGGKGARRI